MTASYVLTADHMYVDVDGRRKHFVRGDELPPIESPDDVDRLTSAGAIAPKGTPVPPRAFEVSPGSVLPDQVPPAATQEDADDDVEPDDASVEPSGKVLRPKQVAPIAAWRKWAKSEGYDEDQVKAATKKELMDLQ